MKIIACYISIYIRRLFCRVCVSGVCECVCTQSLGCVWLFVTPWTVARQAPLSTGFPRREYWSGLPFPSPGDLPYPGIEPVSPALAGRFFTTEPPGKPSSTWYIPRIGIIWPKLIFSGIKSLGSDTAFQSGQSEIPTSRFMRFAVLCLPQLVFTHLGFTCFLSYTSLIKSEIMHFSWVFWSHFGVLCAKCLYALFLNLYWFACIVYTQR